MKIQFNRLIAVLKFKLVYSRNRSTVDLAHKIHGKLGSGAPVIVLHGLLGSKRNWNSISQQINKITNRAVVAVDARNHGDSPYADSHQYMDLAADVDRLMKKLSIAEATFIGHSMGGRTSMVLALTEPMKVSSLVVVDISPVSSPSVLNDFFPKLMGVMKSVNFQGKNMGQAKEEAKKVLQASGIIEHPAFLDFILTNVGNKGGKIGWLVNVDVLNKDFGSVATFPSDVAGKMYPGPTLFVAGRESHFVPPTDIIGIKKIFPQATLTLIENAGHNVHADAPEDFLEVVTKFIKEYSIK